MNDAVGSDAQLELRARAVAELLLARGQSMVTAESCTGGWIAKVLTDVPGSSAWFECGVVAYSYEAKEALLGVHPKTLEHTGAVSQETAIEMVSGALARYGATVAVAVTGVAGPSGGSADKPVGTVWFGWCLPGATTGQPPLLHSEVRHFAADGLTTRAQIRAATVQHALGWLAERLAALD